MEEEFSENYPIISKIIIGVVSGAFLALLNFFATKIYTKVTEIDISFFWKNKYKPLLKLSPLWNLEDLKKRLRIVVIDDKPTFPTKIFKDYGYSIDEWLKVEDIKKFHMHEYEEFRLERLKRPVCW